MKAKTLLVLTLLSLQMFSQPISVELSITWGKGHDIFSEDLEVYVPKLHITYRNMSDTNYYFLKISDSRGGLPSLPYAGSLHPSNFDEYLRWRDNYLGRAKRHGNYANENFNVQIGGSPLFGGSWEVISNTLNIREEHEIDFINCNLAEIYEYMYRRDNDKKEIEKIYFSPTDVTSENILGAVKERFVFLKPDEIYVDNYNLVGFKLLEGRFTFVINQKEFTNYVLTEPIWDENQSYWTEQRKKLPPQAGEYHLYSGLFFTNSVSVDFSEHVADK